MGGDAPRSEPVVTYPGAGEVPFAEGAILGRAYAFGPAGASFLVPVDLTIRYEPDEVPADRDEDALRLHVLDDGVEWVEVPGGAVDLTAHAVTTPIEHFSTLVPAARVYQVPGPGFTRVFLLNIDAEVDSCTGPVPTLGPTVTVRVGEGTVSFGFGTGEYVAGQGDGSHHLSIPVDPLMGCVATVDATWVIQFTSMRRFTGMLEAEQTHTETCPNPDPCSFRWRLVGSR